MKHAVNLIVGFCDDRPKEQISLDVAPELLVYYEEHKAAIDASVLFMLRDLLKRFPDSIGSALICADLLTQAISAIAAADISDAIELNSHDWQT
jgi:hypothetical protein